VDYLKTVPAKSFNPPPKVKSCMIGLTKKSQFPSISFKQLLLFLDAFSPYSRKTLGKISKLLEKK
jgi:16S rRNA A1518/A1519 N6-dimethyltransferase RsmA/KsgA/DIM1 with predicted DNA glycosylase/AP lyase activity